MHHWRTPFCRRGNERGTRGKRNENPEQTAAIIRAADKKRTKTDDSGVLNFTFTCGVNDDGRVPPARPLNTNGVCEGPRTVGGERRRKVFTPNDVTGSLATNETVGGVCARARPPAIVFRQRFTRRNVLRDERV